MGQASSPAQAFPVSEHTPHPERCGFLKLLFYSRFCVEIIYLLFKNKNNFSSHGLQNHERHTRFFP